MGFLSVFGAFCAFLWLGYNPTFYEQTNSSTTFSRQSRRAAELYRRDGSPGRGFEKTQTRTRRSQRTTEKSAQWTFPRTSDRTLSPDASDSSLRREVSRSVRRRKDRRFLSSLHRSGSRRSRLYLRHSQRRLRTRQLSRTRARARQGNDRPLNHGRAFWQSDRMFQRQGRLDAHV